jgi:catechol 2,3-dioxygenase-like lactoylglutathione lyase family enzyme
MIGISHIAVITPDLDRFRAFYEDVVGLRTAIVLRASEPTGFRHAIISVSDTSIVHVFEQPGYDPAAQGVGAEMFTRGRLDHFGFMVGSVAELEAVRDRLVAVGACDGEIAPQGPVYSVRFSDPDGLEGEINAVRLGWDSSQEDQLQVEDEPDPDMYARLVAAGVR